MPSVEATARNSQISGRYAYSFPRREAPELWLKFVPSDDNDERGFRKSTSSCIFLSTVEARLVGAD